MVMKRYPHGAAGPFFFMKRAPAPRPAWIRTCAIEHGSGNVIDFPVIDDVPSLLWVINLGCIDLNQWYARCDDVDRPDYVHFDLDPGDGATFAQVRESRADRPRRARDARDEAARQDERLEGPARLRADRARARCRRRCGRLPRRWRWSWPRAIPTLMTSEYRVAKRPKGRVLVDYNQNAWGRTLASIYSVRPRPLATVSTPLTWDEVAAGVPHRGLPPRQRARADREGRRSLEAAARRAGHGPNLERFLNRAEVVPQSTRRAARRPA